MAEQERETNESGTKISPGRKLCQENNQTVMPKEGESIKRSLNPLSSPWTATLQHKSFPALQREQEQSTSPAACLCFFLADWWTGNSSSTYHLVSADGFKWVRQVPILPLMSQFSLISSRHHPEMINALLLLQNGGEPWLVGQLFRAEQSHCAGALLLLLALGSAVTNSNRNMRYEAKPGNTLIVISTS